MIVWFIVGWQVIQQLEHCLEIMKYLLLVFFDGEEVIAYKTLVSYENDQSVLIDHQDIKRRRDIVKKATIDGVECIWGIEHQSRVDDQMVLRVGNYDFLTYMNQMKKGSKLNGVGTMTLYTGPDKWKKPRRIKEMMSVPKRLDQFIND